MPRSQLDPVAIETLAAIAQLDLPPERHAILAPVLGGTLAQFDVLFDVEVDETLPTNSFDPRWRAVR